MTETTQNEREYELLGSLQISRVDALMAHERYVGARAVLEQAGRAQSWHSTPLAVVGAMVEAIDTFGRSMKNALEAEIASAEAYVEYRLQLEDEDLPEAYCTTCGGGVGIFLGRTDDPGVWQHYRGDGTVESPVELFDADHHVVVGWRDRDEARLAELAPILTGTCSAADREGQAAHDPCDRPGLCDCGCHNGTQR